MGEKKGENLREKKRADSRERRKSFSMICIMKGAFVWPKLKNTKLTGHKFMKEVVFLMDQTGLIIDRNNPI